MGVCNKTDYYALIHERLSGVQFDFGIYVIPENEEDQNEEIITQYDEGIKFLSSRLEGE